MSQCPDFEYVRLAAQGWRLFPCAPRNKPPLLKGWRTLASSDPATIRKWAVKHPDCNWGVACGADSGVWVIDVDGNPGRDSLSALEAKYGPLPATFAVQTARGMHFYFAYPATGTIRNSTGKLGAGLDVRGEGGYVLIPPSTHPSGASYEWVSANLQLAPACAPVWLLEIVTSATRPVVEAREIGILPEGRRNDGLTRSGGYLRRKGLTLPQIETNLLDQNARRCRPPLAEQEVRQIALSVSRYPVGGPDPLETAWQAIHKEACQSNYERFVALALQLQLARPEQPIALPLQRIAGLLGCDWTQPRAYRKRAVLAGIIHRVGDYIPHRKAATYRVTHPLVENVTLTVEHPLRTPTIGLVGDRDFPVVGELGESPVVGETQAPVVGEQGLPSESERKSAEISRNVEVGKGDSTPRCYVHGTEAECWKRADGDLVCERCHPNLADARGW